MFSIFSIPIEHRPPIEACLVRGAIYTPDGTPDTPEEDRVVTVMITPPGLKGIYNPSFDVTPAELISAIVTEKGVAVKHRPEGDNEAKGEEVFDLSAVI